MRPLVKSLAPCLIPAAAQLIGDGATAGGRVTQGSPAYQQHAQRVLGPRPLGLTDNTLVGRRVMLFDRDGTLADGASILLMR